MKTRYPDITPVILAGGKGSRLKQVLKDYPKVLAEINGKPFLTYLFEVLLKHSFENVILCTGYRADLLSEKFQSGYRNLKVLFSPEETPLGTGGAIRLALPQVKTEKIMIFNGDSFTRFDLPAFIEWHEKKNLEISMLATRIEDVSRFGCVKLENNGEISSFVEKGETNGEGLINAGIYLIKKELLNCIPTGKEYSLEKEFFPKFIRRGLFGFKCDGPFIDIGTPQSFATAENFFRNVEI